MLICFWLLFTWAAVHATMAAGTAAPKVDTPNVNPRFIAKLITESGLFPQKSYSPPPPFFKKISTVKKSIRFCHISSPFSFFLSYPIFFPFPFITFVPKVKKKYIPPPPLGPGVGVGKGKMKTIYT